MNDDISLGGSRPGDGPAERDAVIAFRWSASDADLADLRRRLADTRFPARGPGAPWEQGPPVDRLRDLLAYWRDSYDWRRCEARMNSIPQFRTVIDDLGIHFVHVRSPHENARAMVLTHGWPSTFLLFEDVISPLTNPTAHGGAEEDAFHLVIPSLPGFAFSDKPVVGGWNAERIARAWAELMRRLGYERYFAQGGDWGAYVTTAMAQQRAAGLEAIHLNFCPIIPDELPAELLPDQATAVAMKEAYRSFFSGYAHLQGTRPQLAGFGLADSPAAQAAWIYDMFNAGTGLLGDPEAVLGRDRMLDEITLYWLTNSGASSGRLFLEQGNAFLHRNNAGVVDIPVAVSAFPNEIPAARSWASLFYPRLLQWNDVERGGHFASLEEPGLFTEELRSFGRAYRRTLGT